MRWVAFFWLFTLPIYVLLYIRMESQIKRSYPEYWTSLSRREGFLAYPSGFGFHLMIFCPGRLPDFLRREYGATVVWLRILDVYNVLAFIFIAYSAYRFDAATLG